MKKRKPSKQAGIKAKIESNRGDSKGGFTISFKLHIQLKPLLHSFKEYIEYLESNYNAGTGSKEHIQVEFYRNKVLRQWKLALSVIETIHSTIEDKKEKSIFRDILAEYYHSFKKQSHFLEIKTKLLWYVREGQKKKRNRISKEEKAFLAIKDGINPTSFGKFRYALEAENLNFADATISRLWNKYYSR